MSGPRARVTGRPRLGHRERIERLMREAESLGNRVKSHRGRGRGRLVIIVTPQARWNLFIYKGQVAVQRMAGGESVTVAPLAEAERRIKGEL